MHAELHPGGGTVLVCESVTPGVELPAARAEVIAFAEETFLQQRADRLDVKRRSVEAPTGQEREACRRALRTDPPPSMDWCRAHSARIRIQRERESERRPNESSVAHTDRRFQHDG